MKNNIKSILSKQEKSQCWLAKTAGLSEVYLCKVAGGKSEPSHRVAVAIADALGLPVEAVFIPTIARQFNELNNKEGRQ